MKINEALFIKDDFHEKVLAVTLTRKIYFKKYRRHLFCPIEGCSALLSFVERKKGNLKYFRTWSKSEHRKGCPYKVDYDKESPNNNSYEGGQLYNVSDKHINDSLKRAYEHIMGINTFPIINHRNRKINSKKILQLDREGVGLPALFNEGNELTKGKEPYLLIRRYSDLDETDFGQVRCVVGDVHSIFLFNRHGYINLTNKNSNSVKVYFSEHFIVNNPAQFENFKVIDLYINSLKAKGRNVLCCCVGKVMKVKNGFNIHPDRYNGFTLNGLGYYDILNEMGVFK